MDELTKSAIAILLLTFGSMVITFIIGTFLVGFLLSAVIHFFCILIFILFGIMFYTAYK